MSAARAEPDGRLDQHRRRGRQGTGPRRVASIEQFADSADEEPTKHLEHQLINVDFGGELVGDLVENPVDADAGHAP
jgi:hypothetical protein